MARFRGSWRSQLADSLAIGNLPLTAGSGQSEGQNCCCTKSVLPNTGDSPRKQLSCKRLVRQAGNLSLPLPRLSGNHLIF